MNYTQLIAPENLLLAWRRISTGANLQYKQQFRPLYNAFEVAAADHLGRLSERLKGGWQPSSPTRIHTPKASGLQRPLSLLRLEDQIVLQAVANHFAERLRERRMQTDNKIVFSNILNPAADSIFFFRDWRKTYALFERRRYQLLFQGQKWIANFDLAAFYDTIAHELLIREAAPRNPTGDLWTAVRSWLRCWSTGPRYWPYDHGIPQGPIGSDLLSEALLSGVDQELIAQGIQYVRYADDITIFGNSRAAVQDAAIHLEQVCRAHGLIPQVGKFAIRQIGSFDATTLLPSIAPPDHTEEDGPQQMTVSDAERMMARAVAGRPQKIVDKTIARFVLYRAPRSRRLRTTAIRLLARHPEHCDAIYAHLLRYDRSVELENMLVSLVRGASPYTYVRGLCWTLLAGIASDPILAALRPIALARIRGGTALEERVGAFRFLLVCEERGLGKVSHRLATQPVELVTQVAPQLHPAVFEDGVIGRLLASERYELGLLMGELLLENGRSHLDYGLRVKDLAPEVQTAFRKLGLIRRRHDVHVDQVSDMLRLRFRTKPTLQWRSILGSRYGFALSLLIQADALHDANRSHWLQLINSFNDLITKAFIAFLRSNALPGARDLKDPKGHLFDLGNLVDATGVFARAHIAVAAPIRDCNVRRNRLPASHPLEKKRGIRTRHLSRPEQYRHTRDLRGAYEGMIAYVEANR